jgi:hypothetical protein
MPTCLELAGTKATHTHFARSLMPQLHGSPGDTQRAAFTESGYNTYEPQAFEPIIAGLYGPKTRLQNDTSGVPPPQRDPRGAALLDRPAELDHAMPLSGLLDH